MEKQIITLCYRKIIDAASAKPWDKMVFEDSYREFKIQAQMIAQGTPYTTYGELLVNVPGASQLAAQVTPAIIGYVQQLNQTVPDILNNLGRRFLKFKNFQFELINSSITDKSKHQVAVNFYTEPLLWHNTIQNFLLVSDASVEMTDGAEINTNLFELQPYLNIHTLKAAAI